MIRHIYSHDEKMENSRSITPSRPAPRPHKEFIAMYEVFAKDLVRLFQVVDRLKNKNVKRLLRLLDSVDLKIEIEHVPLLKYNQKQFNRLMAWFYGLGRAIRVYNAMVPHFTPDMMAQGLMLMIDVLPGPDDTKFGILSEIPAEFDRSMRDGWMYGSGKDCVYMDRDPEKFFGKALWKFLLDHYGISSEEHACEILLVQDNTYHTEDMDPKIHYIMTSECPTCNAYMRVKSNTCLGCIAAKHAEDLIQVQTPIKKSKKKKRKSFSPPEPATFEIKADVAVLQALGFVF
jgi:hypothetical protein